MAIDTAERRIYSTPAWHSDDLVSLFLELPPFSDGSANLFRLFLKGMPKPHRKNEDYDHFSAPILKSCHNPIPEVQPFSPEGYFRQL